MFHPVQSVQDVLRQLVSSFMHGPCPSPMVVEYMKETLVMSWMSDAALVDKIIREICASERCSPAVPVCLRLCPICTPDTCAGRRRDWRLSPSAHYTHGVVLIYLFLRTHTRPVSLPVSSGYMPSVYLERLV